MLIIMSGLNVMNQLINYQIKILNDYIMQVQKHISLLSSHPNHDVLSLSSKYINIFKIII